LGLTDLSNIKLYATKPHACSYLDDHEATTIFVDPEFGMTGEIYSELSEFGFRRSGSHVYRPKCQSCQACIPIRIPVGTFKPTRAQKRCLKRNSDLAIESLDSIDTDEHYTLYERYIAARHTDGDMYPANRNQYRDFLTSEWGITRYIEYRLQGQLIGVAVADVLESGVSAIYTFFDPELSKRSLGVFNILFHIQWAHELNLPYVYLGYWIKKCQKMNYKVDYRPFQVLIQNSWITVSDFSGQI
jgi:arginyl-tRNA--protein-N-Asp/Glu arginylyltransferase